MKTELEGSDRELRIAALQHVDCEPPAAYGPILEKHATLETFLLGRDQLPDLTGYDGIVVMGGPMGAYDTGTHQWLAGEISGISAAMSAGVAVWGVCLGAQLIAAAAGSLVYPGPVPEVGISPVTLTEAADVDPVFAGLPNPLTVLQWHGDTFRLPDAAVLLATSEAYPHQAFRLGRSYGLQFHLETPLDLAEEWLALPAYRQSLIDVYGPDGMERLTKDLRAAQDEMASIAESMIGRWIETLQLSM